MGTNNTFHINLYDDLACRYNDYSPLESMHAHKAFETAKKMVRMRDRVRWCACVTGSDGTARGNRGGRQRVTSVPQQCHPATLYSAA